MNLTLEEVSGIEHVATLQSMVLEKQKEIGELVEALRESQAIIRANISDVGSCDHSVGFCVCSEIFLTEHNDALLSKYEDK